MTNDELKNLSAQLKNKSTNMANEFELICDSLKDFSTLVNYINSLTKSYWFENNVQMFGPRGDGFYVEEITGERVKVEYLSEDGFQTAYLKVTCERPIYGQMHSRTIDFPLTEIVVVDSITNVVDPIQQWSLSKEFYNDPEKRTELRNFVEYVRDVKGVSY